MALPTELRAGHRSSLHHSAHDFQPRVEYLPKCLRMLGMFPSMVQNRWFIDLFIKLLLSNFFVQEFLARQLTNKKDYLQIPRRKSRTLPKKHAKFEQLYPQSVSHHDHCIQPCAFESFWGKFSINLYQHLARGPPTSIFCFGSSCKAWPWWSHVRLHLHFPLFGRRFSENFGTPLEGNEWKWWDMLFCDFSLALSLQQQCKRVSKWQKSPEVLVLGPNVGRCRVMSILHDTWNGVNKTWNCFEASESGLLLKTMQIRRD